jgi:acyl carrier protein
MTPTNIDARIRGFLAQSVPAQAERIQAMPAEETIWNVVGSLNLLELIDFIEQEFGITVHPLEFIPDNFSSIERIVAFTAARVS